MRATSFEVPIDIPRSQRMRLDFKFQLESLASGIGLYGEDGRTVGLGYIWYTHTGIGTGGLRAVCTIAQRLQRALLSTGIVSRQAEAYLLESRIIYAKKDEPRVIVTLQEE